MQCSTRQSRLQEPLMQQQHMLRPLQTPQLRSQRLRIVQPPRSASPKQPLLVSGASAPSLLPQRASPRTPQRPSLQVIPRVAPPIAVGGITSRPSSSTGNLRAAACATPQQRTPKQRTPQRSDHQHQRSDGAGLSQLSRRSPRSPERQSAQARARKTSPSLGTDTDLWIGGRLFRIGRPLGEGSFGAVWAAEADDGSQAAVKEILCRSELELERAATEGQLLRLLDSASMGMCSPGGHHTALSCLPSLISSEATETGPRTWRVRLAMSRVPGNPLEQFLVSAPQAWAGREPRYQLAEACRYAGELLVQLAPALERISSKVYHRDVSPRNILMKELTRPGLRGSQSQPSFGLVDFGLAVDGSRWRCDESSSDLGGDGRYWPASAWFVFGHGTRELSKHPDLLHEYRTCLDVHALGITALRCLMELTPGLPDMVLGTAPSTASTHVDPGLGVAVPKLQVLWVAWQRYWSDARRFWQPVYDAFNESGDFETLKAAYARASVHRVISADLCALRAALCQARAACESAPPSSGLAGMPAFFDALLLMIRPGREQQAANFEEARQVRETPFESLAPERPPAQHTVRSMRKESPHHDRKSAESWSNRGSPEADVHGCISQSTGTPYSDTSSAAFFASASTSRMTPAQSMVLLEAPASAIGRPSLGETPALAGGRPSPGTRADSASPPAKLKPLLDLCQ